MMLPIVSSEVRGDAGDLADFLAVAHFLGNAREFGDGGLDGLVDAAFEENWIRSGGDVLQALLVYDSASTVAVVVPSPALSEVLDATSCTICAPMFS